VGDVAADDDGAGERQHGGNRMFGQLGQHVLDRLVEVDLHLMAAFAVTVLGRNQAAGVVVHLLDPETVLVDLGLDVAVSRTGNAHAHRAGSAVTGHADHADVVGEILAAELSAEAELARLYHQFLLQLHIAEGAAQLVAAGGQSVEVLGRGQLDGLQAAFSAGAADEKAMW
jgi:hypothetical protein